MKRLKQTKLIFLSAVAPVAEVARTPQFDFVPAITHS
jgi:hypothetical protein